MKEADEILVQRALSGDQKAFGHLVDKYKSATVGLAFHIVGNFEDAIDLAQEAFLKAYLHLASLRDASKFSAWLNAITKSVCHRWLRDNKRGRFFSLEETLFEDKEAAHEILLSRSPKTPEEAVLTKELHENILAALSKLSEKNRLTVMLYFMNGLSYKEIADFEGVPVSTVKGRLYHAKKQLKQELIIMVEETLNKQAPGPGFTGSVMDILNKIEESANRIKDIKYVREGTYYSSEPSLSSIEQKLPDKYRRESDNFIEIRNGETIWRYDKIDRHVTILEVKRPPKSAWTSFLPNPFSIPRSSALEKYHINIAKQNENTTTLEAEKEKERIARRYYHRKWYLPKEFSISSCLPDDTLITYSVRTWEEEDKNLTDSFGVDAQSYVPLFVERSVNRERLRIEVKKIRSFPDGIVLPVEFEIKGPITQCEIRYKDVQVNQGIPDERFLFEPPSDVIVIDSRRILPDVDTSIAEYKKRLDTSIAEYEKRLKEEPESFNLHYSIALFYSRKRASAKALEHCQRAIQLKPDTFQLYDLLGRIYMDLEMWSEAKDAFSKAHEVDKRYKSEDALMMIFQRTGKSKELIELYKNLRRIEEVPNLIALWRQEYGDLVSLIQEYEVKLNSGFNDMDAHAVLAYSYYELGNNQKAIEHFKILQEKWGHFPYERWFQLGLYQEIAQILEENLKKKEEAQKPKSSTTIIQCRLLWVYAKTSQFDKVASLYENIVRYGRGMRDSSSLPGVFWVYNIHFGNMNNDDVRMMIEECIGEEKKLSVKQGGNSEELRTLIQEIETAAQHRKGREASMLYLLVGDSHIAYQKERYFGGRPDMETAIKKYQRAIELDPKNDLAHAALGNARLAQKDYAAAVASYKQAVKLDENQPYYQSQLAYAYNGMDEHDKAIDIGEKLVQKAPDDCDMRAIAGTIYFNAGEYQKAIGEYECAQKLYEEWGGNTLIGESNVGIGYPKKFFGDMLAKAYNLVGASKRS